VAVQIHFPEHHEVQGGTAHRSRRHTQRRNELTQQQVALEPGNGPMMRVGSQQLGQALA
jgi:hypothetical protein